RGALCYNSPSSRTRRLGASWNMAVGTNGADAVGRSRSVRALRDADFRGCGRIIRRHALPAAASALLSASAWAADAIPLAGTTNPDELTALVTKVAAQDAP